jgi:hypothetical protein
MLDIQELQKIMNYFNMSKLIYDKSLYKYGVYKQLLKEIYPRYTDYQLKKIFDGLICRGHIYQVPVNKSYLYQFNKEVDYKPIFKNEPFVLHFD